MVQKVEYSFIYLFIMLLKKFINVSWEIKTACMKHAFISTYPCLVPRPAIRLVVPYKLVLHSQIREAFCFRMIQKGFIITFVFVMDLWGFCSKEPLEVFASLFLPTFQLCWYTLVMLLSKNIICWYYVNKRLLFMHSSLNTFYLRIWWEYNGFYQLL